MYSVLYLVSISEQLTQYGKYHAPQHKVRIQWTTVLNNNVLLYLFIAIVWMKICSCGNFSFAFGDRNTHVVIFYGIQNLCYIACL